jgi:hypothetical protein
MNLTFRNFAEALPHRVAGTKVKVCSPRAVAASVSVERGRKSSALDMTASID